MRSAEDRNPTSSDPHRIAMGVNLYLRVMVLFAEYAKLHPINAKRSAFRSERDANGALPCVSAVEFATEREKEAP